MVERWEMNCEVSYCALEQLYCIRTRNTDSKSHFCEMELRFPLGMTIAPSFALGTGVSAFSHSLQSQQPRPAEWTAGILKHSQYQFVGVGSSLE